MKFKLPDILGVILILSFVFIACNRDVKTGVEKPVLTGEDSLQSDTLLQKINEVSELIEQRPDDGKLYFRRATLYRARGKKMLTLEDLKKAVTLEPGNYEYHLHLANAYFEVRDVEHAIDVYKKCTAIDPQNEQAYLELGRIYLYQAKPRETIENINESLRRNKYNPEAYALKASYYLQMKDTGRAISNLVTSLEVDPDYFNSYLDLGYLFSIQKDPKAAVYYTNALRLKPGNIQVLYNLGIFYQDIGRSDTAISCYRQIIKYVPLHKSSNYNLGYLLFLKNDFTNAESCFSNALKSQTDFPEAWLGKAMCLDSLGLKQKAIESYRKVLELDSNENTARLALRKLMK